LKKLKVAIFPYGKEQENPYQNIIISALKNNGIEVIAVPGRKIFPLLHVLKQKPDIIHLFWPFDMYLGRTGLLTFIKRMMLLLTLPLLKKTPCIYSADNIVSHDTKNQESEIYWISQIIKSCKGILFMSNAAKEIFEGYYNTNTLKTLVVPHPNYMAYYPNETDKFKSREYLNLDPGKKIILLLGRVEQYKGVEELISAFNEINDAESILLIAGKSTNPKYIDHLKNIIPTGLKSTLIFINKFIPEQELQYFFNASDAVVINYKDIPLNPGSLIMAMGFGSFIIAPVSKVLEELTDPSCSILYEADNEEALKNALQQFILGGVNENCRLQVMNKIKVNHDPMILGDKLHSFYQSLMT